MHMIYQSEMAENRYCRDIDYRQLHLFSSTVLYDTANKGRKSKFYDAERVIARRKKSKNYEYLIKWKGWPFHSCSWEPSENLTPALLRSYDHPHKPAEPKLERACRDFVHTVQSGLKSKSYAPIYVHMELDVWRYITHNKGKECDHKDYKLYEKNEFGHFVGLPNDWFYTLNAHGEGMAIEFPIKVKQVLSLTPSKFVVRNGKLEKGQRIPIKKIVITFVKRACNINNVLG